MLSVKLEETRTVGRQPQVTIVVFQHPGNAGQLGALRILLLEGKLAQSVCLPIKHGQGISRDVEDPKHPKPILIE